MLFHLDLFCMMVVKEIRGGGMVNVCTIGSIGSLLGL